MHIPRLAMARASPSLFSPDQYWTGRTSASSSTNAFARFKSDATSASRPSVGSVSSSSSSAGARVLQMDLLKQELHDRSDSCFR